MLIIAPGFVFVAIAIAAGVIGIAYGLGYMEGKKQAQKEKGDKD